LKKNTFIFSLFKWLLISILVGILSGFGAFVFLGSLDYITSLRNKNENFIFLLPLVGLIVAWAYEKYGKISSKGNNLLIEEIESPNQKIPLIMAPLVLGGTLLSHLAGASVGREGTALQISGALADQLSPVFKLSASERRILLLAAIASGFSAIFGTPLAGFLFAIELFKFKHRQLPLLLTLLLSAFIAHHFCVFLGATHSNFTIGQVPAIEFSNIIYLVMAGLAFGLAAYFFKTLAHYFQTTAKYFISNPILKTSVAGAVLLVLYLVFDLKIYYGLGIETIFASFNDIQKPEIFIIKMVLTTFALSMGFKGGEVTPLFFIGATLGSALAIILPLPVAILAAVGFVAVFAGATNTPIASAVMGLELFGISIWPYLALGCLVAYIFSGKKSIYSAQAHQSKLF